MRASYQDYLQHLTHDLCDEHRYTKASAGQPQNWHSFPADTCGFDHSMAFVQSGSPRTAVHVDQSDRTIDKEVFEVLHAESEPLERLFGEALRWERFDGQRACCVATYTTGSIEDPAEQWERHRKWAIDRLLRFRKVFGRRLPEFAEPKPAQG